MPDQRQQETGQWVGMAIRAFHFNTSEELPLIYIWRLSCGDANSDRATRGPFQQDQARASKAVLFFKLQCICHAAPVAMLASLTLFRKHTAKLHQVS